ncbi:uncharacterized protein [Epargyreus clarus]|uniref:uncharacterized protein isoform X2 n=1 Tax=Epargyreus clarus TaxID=520877 RepID=UPI003C2E4584
MEKMEVKELANINTVVTYSGNLGNTPWRQSAPPTPEEENLIQALSSIQTAARSAESEPATENSNMLRPEEIPTLFDAIGVHTGFKRDEVVEENSSTNDSSSRDSDDTEESVTTSEEESDTDTEGPDPSNNGGNNPVNNASGNDDEFNNAGDGSRDNGGDAPMNNDGADPSVNEGAGPPNIDNAGLNNGGAGPPNNDNIGIFNNSKMGPVSNDGAPLFNIAGAGAMMNESVNLFSIGGVGMINTEVPDLFQFGGIAAMKNEVAHIINVGEAAALNNDIANIYNIGGEAVVNNDVPDIFNMGGADALNNEHDFFNIGGPGGFGINYDGPGQFNIGGNLPPNNAELHPIFNGHHRRNALARIEDEDSNVSNDTGIVELDDIQFDMREIFDLFAVDYPGLVGAWQHLGAVNDPRAPAPRFIFRCQADVKAFLWHVLEMYNMQEHNLMFNVEVFSLLMCAVMRGGADKRHLIKLIKAFLHNDMSEVFRIVDFREGWEHMPDIQVFMDEDDEDSGAEEAYDHVGEGHDHH